MVDAGRFAEPPLLAGRFATVGVAMAASANANSSAARSAALSGCTASFLAGRLDAAGRFAAGRFKVIFLALTLAAGRFAAGCRITEGAIAPWDRETKQGKLRRFGSGFP